ncbi:MAG: hypothetical protein LBK61_10700 [Spirochaetaceae bacterium]|nr:hypothetical protein [Spirochaetaceae bacterium]
MRAPAGGENPSGFHPVANLSPILAEGQRQAGRIPSCGVPLRGAKTLPGFHPFVKPTPILAGNQRPAGRIPSCGGGASPSGAPCRRMSVFCLPGTMPDRGGMNR